MPYTDGSVLTAADLNALDARTVPVYWSTVARDIAETAPAEGRLCVIGGVLYVYTGGAWQVQGPRLVRKPAWQSVTSSTTLVNDTDLQVTLSQGYHLVTATLVAVGDPGGDIRTAWTFSGSLTAQDRSVTGPGVASTALASAPSLSQGGLPLTTPVLFGTVGGSTGSRITEELLLNVTAGGVLRLQWAQGTSSATQTSLVSGSRLLVTRVAS